MARPAMSKEKPQTKTMYLIKVTYADFPASVTNGRIQFTVNNKSVDFEEDKEYLAEEMEYNALKNAVARDHIRTIDQRTQHPVVTFRDRRRYNIELLEKREVPISITNASSAEKINLDEIDPVGD